MQRRIPAKCPFAEKTKAQNCNGRIIKNNNIPMATTGLFDVES